MRNIIEEIRERAAAATPGPWGWFGHAKNDMYLATTHSGRQYVMSTRRKGMQGAEFEFQDEGESHGMLHPASELAIFEVCPEATSIKDKRVYRDNITGFRSANATFIAHARQDVDDLLKYIAVLEAELDQAMKALVANQDEDRERWGEEMVATELTEADIDEALNTLVELGLAETKTEVDENGEEVQLYRLTDAGIREAKGLITFPDNEPCEVIWEAMPEKWEESK
jgi:predicted transcriptional regulator